MENDIHIEGPSPEGMYYATSPRIKGLLVAEKSEQAARDGVIPALMDMLQARAALADDRWQDISTAPTDGTHIQIAIIDRKTGAFLSDEGWYEEGEKREEWEEVEDGLAVKLWEDKDEGSWVSNYCLESLGEPTHWMPIAPPAPSTKEGA